MVRIEWVGHCVEMEWYEGGIWRKRCCNSTHGKESTASHSHLAVEICEKNWWIFPSLPDEMAQRSATTRSQQWVGDRSFGAKRTSDERSKHSFLTFSKNRNKKKRELPHLILFPPFSVAFPIGINILLCASSTSSEIHLISIPPSQFFFHRFLSCIEDGQQKPATSRWAIVCTNRIGRTKCPSTTRLLLLLLLAFSGWNMFIRPIWWFMTT
jgi:hypothetical protein